MSPALEDLGYGLENSFEYMLDISYRKVKNLFKGL